MQILIADDDPVSRLLLSRRISAWGFEPVCADDGSQAWDLLHQPAGPPLAILDWIMPGMDGLQLCNRLRAEGIAPRVYIILLTSKTEASDLAAALDAGADDYIRKPCDMEEVRARIGVGVRTLELQMRLNDAYASARASSKQYESLFENANDIVVMVDRSGRFTSVNKATEEISGYKREELIGADFSLLLDKELGSAREELVRGFASSVSGRFESEIVSKDGRRVVIEGSRQPIRIQNEVTGTQIIARDITQRREAEAALAISNANMRALLEGSPLPIIATDLDGIVTSWNTAAASVYGWQPEEALGTFLPTVCSSEDFELSKQDVFLKGGFTGRQVRRRKKDGTIVDIGLSVAPTRDADGNINGTISVHVDLTEMRRVERQYEKLVEEAVLGVFQSTPDGRLISANPALVKMLGFESAMDLLQNGMDITTSYVLPEQRKEFLNLMNSQGYVVDFEYLISCKDGKRIWVSENSRAVRNARGEIVLFEGTIQDVTRRRELEEQLRQAQKIEAVGRLSGGIAHDFNNLLMIIQSYSELLSIALPEDSRLLQYTTEIQKASERGAGLTRQLLAFSRRQVLSAKVLNVNAVISEQMGMLRRLLGEDIQLDLEFSPDLWNVKVDRVQFEQVLMNLVINARDAMVRGGILSVQTSNAVLNDEMVVAYEGATAGPYVCISVSDSGTGIDPEILPRIFEPFFTTKPIGNGTGLGLSTVYGIIRQSGGFISVETAKNVGSTFRVCLPKAESMEAPPVEVPRPHTDSGVETILLIEDEDALREAASEFLRACGYVVLAVGNGGEAFKLVESHAGRIDLLLTDVVMPGMSGTEVAEQLARRLPGLKVLYMSGYSSDILQQHGQIEFDRLLQKPFTLATLAEKVRLFLDRQPYTI